MAFAILDVNTPEHGTPISEWLLRAGNAVDGFTSERVRGLLARLAALRLAAEAEGGWTAARERLDIACEARVRAIIENEEGRRADQELAPGYREGWQQPGERAAQNSATATWSRARVHGREAQRLS